MDITKKIFVAVDTNDIDRAREIITACHGRVYGIKLGLEFFVKFGIAGVQELIQWLHSNNDSTPLKLFLDLKLHDIPNTVSKAIASLGEIKVDYLTLHCSGGLAMLQSAKAEARKSEIKLIGVTLLTSLEENDLRSFGYIQDSRKLVINLAKLADESGLSGIVCSGYEASDVANRFPNLLRIVPGIRNIDQANEDQKRVSTVQNALKNGASFLVVGRHITESKNIRDAIDNLAKLELQNTFAKN